MLSRSRAWVIGALAALSAGGGMLPALRSVPQPQITLSSKRKRGLFNGMPIPSALFQTQTGFRATRTTVAQAKRAALKQRNRQRHKRAARG